MSLIKSFFLPVHGYLFTVSGTTKLSISQEGNQRSNIEQLSKAMK